MPLPHYTKTLNKPMITPINPVYMSNFTGELVMKENSELEKLRIEKIVYKTIKNKDIIELLIQLDDVAFKSIDPQKTLKDILHLIVLIVSNEGEIIRSYLHDVSLIESEISFDWNSDNMASLNVKLRNNNTKIFDDISLIPKSDSLKREYKLQQILDNNN